MNRDDSQPERLTLGDDLRSGSLSSEQREALTAMIATQKRWARRLRSAMVESFVVAGLALLLAVALDRTLPDSFAVPAAGGLAIAGLAVAAVLSVLYFLTARGLSLRVIDARLASIEAELVRIGAEFRTTQDDRRK